TAVLRSPHARARVKRLDATKAREAPGVRAILEPGDVDVLTNEPSYQGQSVAAIAADTFAQARAALAEIDVEWEMLEPLLDPEEAVKRDQLLSPKREHTKGDVERGLTEADAVVEATYRTQTVVHNALETHQAICEWQGDQLVVYISTQFIWGIREDVAEKLGLPQDKVRVV